MLELATRRGDVGRSGEVTELLAKRSADTVGRDSEEASTVEVTENGHHNI